MRHATRTLMLAAFVAGGSLFGCATLEEVGAVRQLEFRLQDAREPVLAGVELKGVGSLGELDAMDALALARAAARDELPFRVIIEIGAENPADNEVTAQLLALDWRLLMSGREAATGSIDRSFSIAPGETASIPLSVQIDLRELFDRDLPQLIDLALAAAGRGPRPGAVRLALRPTVDTPLGRIAFPEEIKVGW